MSFIRKRKKKEWSSEASNYENNSKEKSHSMWSGEKIKEILRKAGLC
ncbi:MAG: hypothetical protein ACP5KW_09195 [Thermoproteota archaeon]|jgi:hypothetical protein